MARDEVAANGLSEISRPASIAKGARPLRIQMVVPSLVLGGMEVIVVTLARAMVDRGHSVGITCLEEEGPLATALVRDGVKVAVKRSPGMLFNFIADRNLRDHFIKMAPDIVHAHSGVWAKTATAAHAAGVPTVVHTAHGFVHNEPWFANSLRRIAARNTKAVIAVSGHLRDYLVGTVRIDPDKVMTLLNGVDTERYRPGLRTGVLRERFGLLASATLLGCVARLDLVKNHACLIEAFALLRSKHPLVRLALVGDGPLERELRDRVARLGLAGDVFFTGAVPDTAPVYRDLDIFVLASNAEGTSISILEALASGTPVVATTVGGTPHLLTNPNCGTLVPPGDSMALAGSLDRLLGDFVGAASLAAVGRAKAVRQFSLATMIGQHEALYYRLASAENAAVSVARN